MGNVNNDLLIEANVEEIPELLKTDNQEEFFRTIEPEIRKAMKQFLQRKGVSYEPSYLDDVVQNTMLNICRNLQGQLGQPLIRDNHTMIIAWIRQIALHTIQDEWRKINRINSRHVTSTDIPNHAPDLREPDDYVSRDEAQVLVKRAINQLSTDQKAIISAVHFDGLTLQDAATKLEIPVGTVKSRLFAARRDLAKILYRMGYDRF